MILDVRTMFMVTAATCFIVAVALFIFQSRRFRPDGTLQWIVGWTFQGLSYLLFGLRGVTWDFLSIVVANTLLPVSYSFLYAAVQQFRNRSYSRGFLLIPPAATFIFFWYFSVFTNNLPYRIVFISILIIVQLSAIVGALLRKIPGAEIRSYWLISFAFLVDAVAWMSRLLETQMLSYEHLSVLESTVFRNASLIARIGIVILSSIGFMLMIRERAEGALQQSEKRYRSLFDSMTEGFALHEMILDDEGKPCDYRFIDINPAFERYTGLKRENVVGKRLSEVLPGEDKYWVESYGQVALTGESIHADHYSPVLKRHYEIFSYRPAPLQFAVVFTDITERKKMEEDIKQRTLELEASNKELESFAYTVSHDLRAPLRAIDGFTKMLVRSAYDKIDQEEKRKFDVIRNNAQKMGLLIDDLLGFSRLGRQALSSSLFNMEDLIKQVWTECRVVAAGRDIELKIDNLPRAFGDEGLMKQVLMNLLSNAIKFTQSRKEAIIDVGGCGKERETVFFVRDNGVGFDMHYSDKLFGVFQRLHSDEEYEGTGVGLAIVQRIIHMHGGRIWADSKIGEGATFYFSLPAAHTHAVKAASSNTLVVLSET